jgi:hypothetical protein
LAEVFRIFEPNNIAFVGNRRLLALRDQPCNASETSHASPPMSWEHIRERLTAARRQRDFRQFGGH